LDTGAGAQDVRDRNRQRLRVRSKAVFGNADRLEVASAVARSSSGVVHAQELSQQLGISPPRVRAQLLALVEADLMTLLPRSGLTQDYERRDDPFWAAMRSVYEHWE
jgi:DNA-binding transcriptional ArsR family regulator